jgi:hypothetical protein
MDSKEVTDFQTRVKEAQSKILRSENMSDDTIRAFSDESTQAKSNAENVLKNPIVKERICAVLQSISDDLNKITEKTTELILGMVVLGTLVITQNPLVYAWIGILVYRATIKGFCMEFQANSKASKN